MATKDRRFTQQEQQTLADILAARRDVRGNHFTQQLVSEDNLNQILNAAAVAPSVGLSQPWRFVIIRDGATKQRIYEDSQKAKLSAANSFTEQQKQQYLNLKLEGIKEAPINVAVYYEAPSQTIIGNDTMPEMGEYSVVCAIQNMWLMARALNIGVGWVSILSPATVNDILKAPKHLKLVAYLCIGQVDEFLAKPEFESLNWAKSKAIDSVLVHESFD